MFCEYYKGIQDYCSKGWFVNGGEQSINCDDFELNEEMRRKRDE